MRRKLRCIETKSGNVQIVNTKLLAFSAVIHLSPVICHVSHHFTALCNYFILLTCSKILSGVFLTGSGLVKQSYEKIIVNVRKLSQKIVLLSRFSVIYFHKSSLNAVKELDL